MANSPDKVDILHPCAKLKWTKCRRLPVRIHDAQAVCLGDKIYVGGGTYLSSGSRRDAARLYIYTPVTDTWSHIAAPVYEFALITYQLVGGREYVGEERDGPVTNKLWTLTIHDQWRETLPPMTTKRCGAMAVEFADNILVAGGQDDEWRDIDIVEVYNGHHWAKAQCLPKPGYWMKSTVFNEHWYLMGGEIQGKEVYYASLDSLVASCQPSEKPLPSVWNRFPDVPHDYSNTTVFGNKLITVGGGGYPSPSSSIHAYSPDTQSWVYVGDMPVRLGSTCIAVLPTGELTVIGGVPGISSESCVHQATINFISTRTSYTDRVEVLRDQCLNATIFSVNKINIQHSRPKNILKCLEADGADPSRSEQVYRQLYLSNGLAKADHMYTTDVKGHSGCVHTLALSNQGEELMVSGGNDMRVLVWRVADMIQAGSRTPKPTVMKSQHSAGIFTANFSCDNQYIYSGGDDFELIKHDLSTGKLVSKYEHCDAIYSVAPHPSSPSIVLSASEDGCVYTIDTRQPHRRVDSGMVLCGPLGAYNCAVYNPVEPRLAAICNSDSGTALYDTRQKKRIIDYKCDGRGIAQEEAMSACFDRTGRQLYVVHYNHPPCLYDLWHEEARFSFKECMESYRNTVMPKSGCFMGQDDEYVVCGSDDFRVYIWKIPNPCQSTQPFLDNKEVNLPHLILPGHRSIVNHTCYSKVHHVLATSGVENIIKLWSHERLNSSQTVSRSGDPPARLRYSSSERNHLIDIIPTDPLAEDSSIIARVDALIEENETAADEDVSLSDDRG